MALETLESLMALLILGGSTLTLEPEILSTAWNAPKKHVDNYFIPT